MRPFTIAILNFISSVSSRSSLQQEVMKYSMIFKVLYFKQIVGINKILAFKSNSDYVLLSLRLHGNRNAWLIHHKNCSFLFLIMAAVLRRNTTADGAHERKLLRYSVLITVPNYSQITMQNASALNEILVIDMQSEPNISL